MIILGTKGIEEKRQDGCYKTSSSGGESLITVEDGKKKDTWIMIIIQKDIN